jgi:hypothetical protein
VKNVRAAIVHRNAFRAVLGSDAQKMFAPFAEQFDGFDDDRILEMLAVEDRSGGGAIHIGLQAASLVLWRTRLRECRQG